MEDRLRDPRTGRHGRRPKAARSASTVDGAAIRPAGEQCYELDR
jgi:hypothetical protein